ncbi:hypothetical protein H8D76_01870 [Candidatus Bathyarchaeota archaeon]|nr:hypothetical protein [Candidatus Bathyarchaeota archaeon]
MDYRPEDVEEEEEIEIVEYLIPKNLVNSLIDNFGILKNQLNEVLDIPVATSPAQATGWWRVQSGDDQLVLRSALTAIAAPALISQITIMRGNERMIGTTLVQESMRADDPCFLVGEDENGDNLRIRRLRTPDVMAGTMIMYLDSNMELGVADFNFTIEIDDFHTLLGVIDLFRRQYYQALMEHESAPTELQTDDILKSIKDAHEYGDPRWLLPFALPALPTMQVPDKNTLNHSLYDLGKVGVISITDDYSTVSFTDPSELLVSELLERPTSIRVTNLGFNTDGTPAGMSSLFLRGENLVWYVNIGGEAGETATIASVELEQVSEILKELFTPVGAPPNITPVSAQSGTPMCPKCGKPATWVEQYKRWYCHSCQEYLEV